MHQGAGTTPRRDAAAHPARRETCERWWGWTPIVGCDDRPVHQRSRSPVGVTERLVLSIAEVAEALGLSDDLVYHLVARGELPCLRFGRRKVVPRVAVEEVIQLAMDGFDPSVVLRRVAEHSPEELGDLAVSPGLEVGVNGEGRLPSPTVPDPARHLRKLHAGTEKRRHDEVAEPVQMNLLIEPHTVPQGPEPAAR